MADKNYNIDINVKSSSVKTATDDLKQLDSQLQNVTKSSTTISKGVTIMYENGKAIDVVTDSTQRLNRQSTALVNAMALLQQQGKQNSVEYGLLSKKHLELQSTLERTKTTSKDLFGSLAMLPGPVGEFAGKIQGAVDLLKTFGGLSVGGIKAQFSELGDILKSVVGIGGGGEGKKNENNTEAIKEETAANEKLNETLANQHENYNGNAAAAKAYADETKKIQGNVSDLDRGYRNLLRGQSDQFKQSVANAAALEKEGIIVYKNGQYLKTYNNATYALTAAEKSAIETGKALAVTDGMITVAEEEATVATNAWAVALGVLEAAFAALAIGVIIAGAVKLYDIISELIFGTKKFNLEINEFNKGLEAESSNIDKAIDSYKNYYNIKISEQKKANATSEQIRNTELQSLLKQQEVIKRGVKEADEARQQALDKYVEFVDIDKKTGEFSNKLFKKEEYEKGKAAYEKALGDYTKLTKQATDLDAEIQQKGIDNRTATDKEYRDRRIKELDNAIKNELEKNQTNLKNLAEYLQKKQSLENISLNESGQLSGKIIAQQQKDLQKIYDKAAVDNANRLIDAQMAINNKVIASEKAGSKKAFDARLSLIEQQYTKEKNLAQLDIANKETLLAEAENKKIAATKAANEERQRQIIDYIGKEDNILTEAIKNDEDRDIQARKLKFKNDQRTLEEDVNFIESSEETKSFLRNALQEKADRDIEEIESTKRKKEIEKVIKHIELLSEIHKSQNTGFFKYYKDQQDLLDQQMKLDLENTKLTEEQKEDIRKQYAQKKKQLQKDEINDIVEYGMQILGAAGQIFGQMQQVNQLAEQQELSRAQGNAAAQDQIKRKYFEKNKTAQIGETVISTAEAAVNAYKSLAGIPFVGPALGAAAAAAAVYFGYQKVALIQQTQYDSGGATAASQTRLKNYGDGGMIEGNSHAGGGVRINAEGGEAVMNKNSVAMFKPLLSAMNQMGGGTSFQRGAVGQASYDNPKQSGQHSDVQIIKTYVVESELTSMQHKQQRLKELSTL